MDSPTEFGPVSIRQFDIDGRTFRFSAHHTGTAAELDAFVKDVEKIVRQGGAIFGEYPTYESGSYTFLADYLPYASGDGMEHRNSTVITSSGSIRGSRNNLLVTVAHEFLHCWNVERIRPRSLEPFDFERANMSGELWLAEGFNEYYGPISLSRAGLEDLSSTTRSMAGFIEAAANPGRDVRSAEEMSRMAAFTDGNRTWDRTNWSNTYISYYSFGGAIALGLDLSLRSRSDGRVTLDDFMRAMWRVHGKPGGAPEGYVAHPYTIDDAEQRLAEVSGDAGFAREFFARYVHGHDAPDFAVLLRPAGFAVRKSNAGRAWWGDVRLTQSNGLRVAEAPAANSPAYKAGLDVDDEVRLMDGVRVTTADDVTAVMRRHKPGDTVSVDFADRSGAARAAKVIFAEDPRMEVLPIESAGGTLTPAQRAFRRSWLGQ
jgi:predicted metalloprotease with PDZ domain